MVYTAVDNPAGIQFGGVVAAPIVQNILRDSLQVLKVPPRKDQLPKAYKYGDTPIVTVPDLVGATVQDLYEDLNMNFVLSKSGTEQHGRQPGAEAGQPGGTRVDHSHIHGGRSGAEGTGQSSQLEVLIIAAMDDNRN